MKTNLITLFTLLILTSCTTRPAVTIDKNNAEVTPRKKVNPYDLIIGKWKMESYQVYSPDSDPTDSREIIWEFTRDNEMHISTTGGKTATMNTSRYWMNEGIVKVNEQLYIYQFDDPYEVDRGGDIKSFGDELWLDSNLDPSISAHGPKIYFTRMR